MRTRRGRLGIALGLLAAVAIGVLIAQPWQAPDTEREVTDRDEAPAAAPPPILLGASAAPNEKAPPASDPGSEREAATPEPAESAGAAHIIRGRVVDARTNAAVVGARVLYSQEADEQSIRLAGAPTVSTTTGDDGRYELAFQYTDAPAPTTLLFTVLARGYQTPHALPEGEGEVEIPQTRLRITAAGESRLDFRLRPGLDVAGVVVDEEGTPIPAVSITVTENDPGSTRYVEFLSTDDAGRFCVHDIRPPVGKREPRYKGTLDFTHPTHIAAVVEDVHALDAGPRAALRIVMRRGVRLAGHLLHADGSPAPDVLVAAYRGDPNENRRGARTDVFGFFELRGLAAGKLTLRALSGARLEFVQREITLLRTEDDLELRLEPMAFARNAKRERMLGLEFVAVPKDAREALGLYKRQALLITTIGDDTPAGLREHASVGDVLWRVGRKDVTSAREVAAAVIERVAWLDTWRAKGGHALRERCSVRFVLGIRRHDIFGTNTQSMQLPRKQIDALRTWLEDNPETK